MSLIRKHRAVLQAWACLALVPYTYVCIRNAQCFDKCKYNIAKWNFFETSCIFLAFDLRSLQYLCIFKLL